MCLRVELEALRIGGHVRTGVRHDSGVVQARWPGLDGVMDTSATLPQLDETLLATTRYLQALTVLDDESVRRPSVLPGWTRGHVVAHLSRNADAFAQLLDQASAGRPAYMYASDEARDRDIDETVDSHDRAALLKDAHRSSDRLAQAWRTCAAAPETTYSRLPEDDQTFALHTVGFRRRAEVEIHHADLDLGYSPAGWLPDFSVRIVGQRQAELAALGEDCPSMVLSATDVEGLWRLGDGAGPEIRGPVGELAWWLVGRDGRALTCSSGELPVLGRWR
jgi:maleylpyruvate isomerase